MVKTLVAAALVAVSITTVKADTQEAMDRAYEMAGKYAAMGYYMAPSKEGYGGFGVTLEFQIPVNAGLDYMFIAAGDRNCEAMSVYIESENGNTLVKDIRRTRNGLAGVSWRSDYNGNVNVVVHFARVSDRCGWAALVGRRGTVRNTLDIGSEVTTPTGPVQKLENTATPAATGITK